MSVLLNSSPEAAFGGSSYKFAVCEQLCGITFSRTIYLLIPISLSYLLVAKIQFLLAHSDIIA